MVDNGERAADVLVSDLLRSDDLASDLLLSCKKCHNGNKVTVEFPDSTYIFHSQWLHDARCNKGAARNAVTAICQQPISTVHVDEVHLSGQGNSTFLHVAWDDGQMSEFPGPWLRVMAPLVARLDGPKKAAATPTGRGWLVDTLVIPEVSYNDIVQAAPTLEKPNNELALEILDRLLNPSSPGIVKVINLPEPNVKEEKTHKSNINTFVLKSLFGSVFVHPIRGSDQTFNVSSHDHDAQRAVGLANYDTTQLLLPHSITPSTIALSKSKASMASKAKAKTHGSLS